MPNSSRLVTGCDLVQISRFAKTLQEHNLLLDKIFTTEEKTKKSIDTLAGIFAAKEAAIKALGLRPGRWHQIIVTRATDKKPHLTLSDPDTRAKIEQLDLSISHDGDYALAIIVAMLK